MVSAVSIGGDVLHLLTFLAMGFSAAGQVIIAQYIGAGQHDRVQKLIGTMFTFLLGTSLVISIFCYIIRNNVLNWLNTPAESYDYTMDYMVTCIIGLVFICGYNIVSAILQRLLALGIPMAIQSASISISKIVLTSWINSEGMIYSALSGIYNKTGMFMGVVSNSFTTAGSSMVGQNIGARKFDRVTRVVRCVGLTGLVVATAFSAVVLLFPTAVCEMFTSDAAVLAESSLIIMPIVINAYGAATRSPAFAIINGSGNSRLNLLVAILDGMIARIGLAYILGFGVGLGSLGFWYGDALAGFMPITIGGIFYLSGKWKTNLK